MKKVDHLSDEQFLDLMYSVLLGREPDGPGFSGFLQAIRNGQSSRQDVVGKMVCSEEFRRKYPGTPLSTLPDIERISDENLIDLTYQLILRRRPDPGGASHFLREIKSGRVSRLGIVDEIIMSSEYAEKNVPPFIVSLHASRCAWVKSLPRADRIIDLGGSSAGDRRGSLVAMGYPYPFEELIIVDLPLGQRHTIYSQGYDTVESFQSDRGKISYVYVSMDQLQQFSDSSADLMNMGESIEHITGAGADHVLDECYRILRPGGFLCIDTPNGAATRLQSENFIDPDHKVEYTHRELSRKIEKRGFAITEQKGLNYLPSSFEKGLFDIREASRNSGLYDDIEHSYLLAYRCKKIPE